MNNNKTYKSAQETGVGDIVQPCLSCDDETGDLSIKQVKRNFRYKLFFDGTGNNKFNVDSMTPEKVDSMTPEKVDSMTTEKKGSYAGYYTNIAHLAGRSKDEEKDFTYTRSFYIEGIGTARGEVDNGIAQGLGILSTGIKDRVEFARNHLVEQIKADANRSIPQILGVEGVVEVVIDLFGFSRGAAAARYFIHFATIDKENNIKTKCGEINVNKIIINFVGLFDTVASYGFAHWNDTKDLHLDSIKSARKVVHLVAADEHRLNFRLTNIQSAGSKGEEIFLPGVHSDVGGGYLLTESETDWEILELNRGATRVSRSIPLAIRKPLRVIVQTAKMNPLWRFTIISVGVVSPMLTLMHDHKIEKRIDKEIRELVSAGWYQYDELKTVQRVHATYLLANRKEIKNNYSYIPLKLMMDLAAKINRTDDEYCEVSFDRKEHEFALNSADLKALEALIRNKVKNKTLDNVDCWTRPAVVENNAELLRRVRHSFFHFSARYNDTYFGVLKPHKPQFTSEDGSSSLSAMTGKRKRKIQNG